MLVASWRSLGHWRIAGAEAGEDRSGSQIGSRETHRNRQMMGVSRQAISFLFGGAGAGLVSPADQTPFPLIKSVEIFHLSVSRPRRVARGEQPAASVDCVILQFTSDTDDIITSLMPPWLVFRSTLCSLSLFV